MGTNLKSIHDAFNAFFPESELEWRAQSCGISKSGKPYVMALCYVQARAIERRLDDVVGFENWQSAIRVEGDNIISQLSVRIGGEWIAKENGAPQTDIEAFKGGVSGAFKRVASHGFGIGRYLYELKETFAECTLEPQKGDEWNRAKTRGNPTQVVYWKTPAIPSQFLPKPEVDTAAEKVDNHAKQVDASPKQVDKERLFTAEEADAVKIWAKGLYGAADVLVPVLKKLGVERIEQLPYAKRPELIKLGKETAAEFKALDEGAKNG